MDLRKQIVEEAHSWLGTPYHHFAMVKGAGVDCDGQVLVYQDMVGMNKGFKPKFLRKYLDLYTEITNAVEQYVKGVKGYWTLSHINIPVTFQFKFIPQVYIETGPEVNITIKSEEVITDKAGYNNIPDKKSFKEYTKGAFFGWNFGGGYFITEKFSVNLRYSMGITSPYNEKEDHNGKKDRAKFRTGNLQLGLSYHF